MRVSSSHLPQSGVATKTVIHLMFHKNLVADGKCRESMDKIKRLITKEVDHTPNAKISIISFSANKTFWAAHLLDDTSDGIMELLNNEKLEQIQDKFLDLSLPNVHNLVIAFKHCVCYGYIDSILELSLRAAMITSRNVTSQVKLWDKRFSFSRCQ
jgi:hypothetical protein